MREVYNSSEKDGHGKGAGLTEKIHYTGQCTGSLAAYVYACGKTIDHGKRQKKMGGYKTEAYRQVVAVFGRQEYQ